ncbi:MAG TPA: ATP-binding protein [Bryobacteraceae bacterium]|jgi:signal transduction histidine kinase|nr:ATP-binding protein [Bryobacteraceae bacterium]
MTDVTESLILNVDDYVPGRYARTKLLKQAGYRVLEAGNGRETFAAVQKELPKLILLDVNLPDISGFEICRQLRDNPVTAATTILHISASSVLAHHQVNGLDAGADGYLVEPIEPAILLATVNAFLRARRAEEEMRKSNEELRWFAYRVGHDLNEPLRTIASYVELLNLRLALNSEASRDVETSRSLQFISDGATKMRFFIDGLLQYAQAGAGDNKMLPIACDDLVERVMDALETTIHDSGAMITRDSLPVLIANEQIEYVFQNLISNAIKYRKPGIPPEIHISARRDGDGDDWIFAVRDNGMGIEPQFRGRIFTIFNRLHGHDIPGAGIGLALARRIVEAHGGKIWVESEEGVGSTFCFRLPRQN